jgi:transcriptional regulator with XRE-family HTH domain
MTDGPSIDVLIERISARLAETDQTERAVSIKATGSPDALRYIRTRRAMPSGTRLQRIAAALECSADYLLGASDAPEPLEPKQAAIGEFSRLEMAARGYLESDLARVFSCKVSGAIAGEGHTRETELPIIWLEDIIIGNVVAPRSFNPDALRCFYNPIDYLSPVYEKLVRIYIDELGSPQPGDYVAVFLETRGSKRRPALETRDGTPLVLGRLELVSKTEIMINSLSPSVTVRLSKTRINAVRRLVSYSDLA